MSIKRFILIASLTLGIFTAFFPIANAPRAEAEEVINAGFVSGLWYSSNNFFAGDNVRIYSAIQNNSGFDIVGKVQFFDNEEVVGEAEFSALDGRLVEKWADWQAKGGDRNIYVRLTETKKALIGGGFEDISLAFDSSRVDKRFVDLDADGDKIGDTIDTDDDNDGLSDEEEKTLGTDSLNKDTDGDGYSDGEEVSNGTDPLVAQSNNIDKEEPPKYEGYTKVEDIKDIAKSVGQKTGVTIDNIVDSLKDRKIAVDDIGGQEDTTSQSNYYSKLLSVLIYILERKWLLVLGSFLLALIIGKILRII